MSPRSIYTYCTEPPLPEIYSNIGFIFEKNGRFAEAVNNHEQGLKEKSSDSEQAIVHSNLDLLQHINTMQILVKLLAIATHDQWSSKKILNMLKTI